MLEIPRIYSEFLEIIDKEPEDNIFAKLAKFDLKYRIASHVLKNYSVFLEDLFKKIFEEVSKIDTEYFKELAIDYIKLLTENNKIDLAIRFIKEKNLEHKIPLDIIASTLGLKGLSYLDNFSEELRDKLYAKIWINEVDNDKAKALEAFEKIRGIKDPNTKISSMLELAELLLVENQNNKELVLKIIKEVEESIGNMKQVNKLYTSKLIRIKCLINENCIEYFKKTRDKIGIVDYRLFLPYLALRFIGENKVSDLEDILNKYIEETGDEEIYLAIIQVLAEHNMFKHTFRYILRIKNAMIATHSYLALIEKVKTLKESDVMNYINLAVTNLINWFDNNILMLRQMADKIKQEDKRYKELSLTQILLYHPQVSAYFRNITTVFYNTLRSMVNVLVSREMLDKAYRLINYICTTKEIGCELRDMLLFTKAWKENDIQKTIEIMKKANITSLLNIVERIEDISDDEKLSIVLKEALFFYAKNNKVEEIKGVLPIILEKNLLKEALEAVNLIKDEKSRIELKLMIANKIINLNEEKLEEIISDAKSFIEKHGLEESSNIARLLAPILFKKKRFDETLEIVKKYLKAKDKWLAGLIISSIFKKID